jgi:ankyrin repeat protein
VRAIRLYAPPELQSEVATAVDRAAAWLTSARTASTEDAAFRLLGLVWARAPADARVLARRDLESRQTADGGWPQLPGSGTDRADAYSTGQALVALHTAGTPTHERAWQRGLSFLLRTQARDGTWRVRTRMLSPATVSPPYFDAAFPYEKDAFISYAGTAWAVMALLSALPPQPSEALPRSTTAPASQASAGPPGWQGPAWLRTALFSPAADLERLLDAGLSPRSTTAGGTTLLMAAATNPTKVSLLLARGADPAARAPSGTDALTVAASYRGTAASVRRLLDAGVAPAPPPDVRVKHTPLALASMSGDLETVTELLARGAEPSAVALAESITFDNPHVTRLLLARGADASIEERTGVTLLHWAVITNRAEAIPLLAAANLDVNRKDSFGFTPLMYAATIDQGHTRLVEALLAAGADRRMRNQEGRTARQQAQHLGHSVLARALR